MEMDSQHPSPEAIADDVSDIQRKLLLEYDGHDVRNTKQLREGTEEGIDNNKINYHMKRASPSLIDQGLVEFIGYDEEETSRGKGQPAMYAITDLGSSVLTVFRQREAKTEADVSRVDELEGTVERLEEENNRIRERLNEAEAELEKHKEAIRYMRDELGL